MREWDPTNTSVAEIHYLICEEATKIANQLIADDPSIPRGWASAPLMNDSPYADDEIALRIKDEWGSAPDDIKSAYHKHAITGIRQAIANRQEMFAGMIFGEAREGRNYFDRYNNDRV